jgi:competence protein ComEC
VRDGRALREDCHAATVLISTVPVDRHDCANPVVLVDRFDLWREGTHALWLRAGSPRVVSVRASRGERPWVRDRGRDQ